MNMNDSPGIHLDDETLSIALDEGLRARGVPEIPGARGVPEITDEVAAHLAGCSECSRRSGLLAAARAALAGAPVEPLDELARRRLVTRALAEASPAVPAARRWYRHPGLAGGIAAALLIVIAVTVPILRSGRSERDKTASSEAALLASAPFLGDLGDVSDPAMLRERLQADLGSPSAFATSGGASASKSAADNAAPPSTVAPVPAAGATGSGPTPQARTAAPGAPVQATPEAATDASVDQSVAQQCASTVARGPARGARLVATGIGTYRGSPVVTLAFAREQQTTVYLAARDGCRVLASYPL